MGISSTRGASALVLASLLLTGPLRAEAIFSASADHIIALPEASQVAIFRHQGRSCAHFALDVDVQTGDGEFAWVTPFPSAPTVGDGDLEVVAELDALTAPRWGGGAAARSDLEGEAGCSCASGAVDVAGCGGAAELEEEGSELRTTQMVSRSFFDPIEVAVLSSEDGDDLAAWLTDHNYAVPADFTSVIDPYVLAGWHFVALRYEAPLEAPRDALSLEVCYDDPEFVYPTQTLALTPTAVAYLPLTIMVVAESPTVVANHENHLLPDIAGGGWGSSVEYWSILERELVSDARIAWVVESTWLYRRTAFPDAASPTWERAVSLGMVEDSRDASFYVSRLTTLATRRGAAALPDLQLQLDPRAQTLSPEVAARSSSSALARVALSSSTALPLLALVALGTARRRSRGTTRVGGASR